MAALAASAHSETMLVRSVVLTDAKTGKLVRKTISQKAAPLATQEKPFTADKAAKARTADVEPDNLAGLIEESATRNEVEAPLIRSVIRAESNYNPLAVSNKGARGLMQLIPETAKRFGVKDSFDSKENVEGGVKYLKYLIDLYHGDYARAVAAYNAGEKAVARYGGVPPFKETQNYVATVSRHLAAERQAMAARLISEPADHTAMALTAAATAPSETYNPVVASVSADGKIYYRTP